jgi:hypothetical protein
MLSVFGLASGADEPACFSSLSPQLTASQPIRQNTRVATIAFFILSPFERKVHFARGINREKTNKCDESYSDFVSVLSAPTQLFLCCILQPLLVDVVGSSQCNRSACRMIVHEAISHPL